jgi:hypothetical protein
MKKRKGEIGTIVMMAILVIVSVIGFSSQKFLSQKNTVNTNAGGNACGPYTDPKPEPAIPLNYCAIDSTGGQWYRCVGNSLQFDPTCVNDKTYQYADQKNSCCFSPKCVTEAAEYSYSLCSSPGTVPPATNTTTTNTNATNPPSATNTTAKCGSGNGYDCDPDQGYDPKGPTNLQFNCCVADSLQNDGTYRIRRYGYTGQYCKNTIINNALGHLVGCAGFTDGQNGSFLLLNASKSSIVLQPPVQATQPVSQPTSGVPSVPNCSKNQSCSVYCSTEKGFTGGSGNYSFSIVGSYSFNFYKDGSCQSLLVQGNTDVPQMIAQCGCSPLASGAGTGTPAATNPGVTPGITPGITPGVTPGVTPPSVLNPTITPISTQFHQEGTCNSSGTKITFGSCNYYNAGSGLQPCSNSTPLGDTPAGCTIFRVCGNNSDSDCRYECYQNGTKYNCSGVADPHLYDYVHIINSTSVDKVIGNIVLEKGKWLSANPTKSLGGAILHPNEMISINLRDPSINFMCETVSVNTMKVWLFDTNNNLITSGSDGCGGGVKILIVLK